MKMKPENSTWTDEQWEAITHEGENTLVSAGAGSGKTAVLSTRVIEKIKDGMSIDKLILITFTNAAAFEMKTRIKDKLEKLIKEDPSYKEQLDLLDQAYITTFDGLALSLVKKYHYLLGVDRSINIIDNVDLNMKKKALLDQIIEDSYDNKEFTDMLDIYTNKDDESIKEIISSFYDSMDIILDKKEYLNTYIDKYYSKEALLNYLTSYMDIIYRTKEIIINMVDNLSSFKDNFDRIIKFKLAVEPLKEAKNYQDIKYTINEISFPIMSKKLELDEEDKEALKKYNKKITEYKDSLKDLTSYSSLEEIEEEILETKPFAKVVVDILLKLDSKVEEYKRSINSYSFSDITRLAIKLLEGNEEVRDSIKNNTKEIMIDEYQDTNRIGDYLVSLISNNNVYMVGDVKQSIYRFRYADPSIFMEKYQNYKNGNGGHVIDLNKNFRSRDEVLSSINDIFEYIMDEDVGGANYSIGHKMIFGFLKFLNLVKSNYNLEVYDYSTEEEYSKGKSKDIIEAFIIAKDIKNKLSSGMEVYDKEEGIRPIQEKDFCIIAASKTHFDTYKKVLDYYGIKSLLYKNEEFSSSNEIYVLRNILKLINNIKNNEDIKYPFLSIARSYLFDYKDNDIFTSITNNDMRSNPIFKDLFDKIDNLVIKSDNESISNLLLSIYKEFDMYSKSIRIGNIDSITVKLDYLVKNAKNLEEVGYTLSDYIEYLNDIYTGKLDIEMDNKPDPKTNAVKIMTIHASKGLEFPICYFPDMYKEYNDRDLNSKFMFDYKYGFIMPVFNEGKKDTIIKTLAKDNYYKEDRSEKIRTLYVALTRAREKLIIVAPLSESKYLELPFINGKVSKLERVKHKSFLDVLGSIKSVLKKYITHVNYEVDTNYLKTSKKDITKIKKLPYKFNEKYLNIDSSITEEKSYSHTRTEIKKIDSSFGTYIHEVLEYLDFNNPKEDINNYNVDNFMKSKILKLFEAPFINKDAKVYKEYEFYNNDTKGIIDLLLEYEDKFIVVDYKLKDIEEDYYVEQVKGYMEYIKSITSKKVEGYLYSVIDSTYKEIK